MKVSYGLNAVNVKDIVSILDNNATVTLAFELTPTTGLIIKKEDTHFFGYRPQTAIEISYYENEDGFSRALYGTEVYNELQSSTVSRALLQRFSSTEPMSISNYALDLETVLVKESE